MLQNHLDAPLLIIEANEHGKRCCGLGDLNVTNKQNKQSTFFIDR